MADIKLNDSATPLSVQFYHDLINEALGKQEVADDIPEPIIENIVGNLQALCWFLGHGNEVLLHEGLPDPHSLVELDGENLPEDVVPATVFHLNMKKLEATMAEHGYRMVMQEDDGEE